MWAAWSDGTAVVPLSHPHSSIRRICNDFFVLDITRQPPMMVAYRIVHNVYSSPQMQTRSMSQKNMIEEASPEAKP